jgi:hypothetical protein
VTLAAVYFGRDKVIIETTMRIKEMTIRNRRLRRYSQAA